MSDNNKRLIAFNTVTIGNATSEPELRYTQDGKAVCNVNIARNDRIKGADGQWTDGPATFYRVSAWEKLAEHLAMSVHKGERVIVTGHLYQNDFVTKEGVPGSSLEITADEVGPSLRFGTTVFTKAQAQAQQPVQYAQTVQQAPAQQVAQAPAQYAQQPVQQAPVAQAPAQYAQQPVQQAPVAQAPAQRPVQQAVGQPVPEVVF